MATSLPYSHVDSDLRVLAAQAEGSVAEPSVASMGPLLCLDSSGHYSAWSHLNVSSYKTIDGWAQKIKLTGKGLRLKECDMQSRIKPKSKNIWIDCCSLCDYDDGLIDITRESTDSKLFLGVTLRSMIKRCSLDLILPICIRITNHYCFFDEHQKLGVYAVYASVKSQKASTTPTVNPGSGDPDCEVPL
uniref:Uncharacterized protein n=1 Tax=Salix viminalis TaxID=40686 RepID=A0A6N2MPW3_SALVM